MNPDELWNEYLEHTRCGRLKEAALTLRKRDAILLA